MKNKCKIENPKMRCSRCGQFVEEDCEHVIFVPKEDEFGFPLVFCDDCWELTIIGQ